MNEYRSHLSVTTWIVLASLVLGQILRLPERVWTLQVFGSPIDLRFSGTFLAGLLALAATWAGLEAALRTHPNQARLRHTYRFWGLPSAITLLGMGILPTIQDQSLWLLVLGVLALGLAASMAGEYHTVDPADPHHRQARWLLNILAYATAALAFILIYLSRSRSLVSATLMGIMAGLLAMDLLRESARSPRDLFLASGILALLIAQFTVLLNYWPFPSIRVALMLLVGFYLAVGLWRLDLKDQATLRRVGEQTIMALVAFLIIIIFPGK